MSRMVVFDLDDTLYLERDFVWSGFRAVDQWLLRERGIAGFADLACSEYLLGARQKIFDKVLESFSIASSPELVAQLVKVYREHSPELSLLPDAVECLRCIREKEAIGLITDGYHQTQVNKVRALQIESHFARIVYSDAIGRDFWKPHTSPYEAIMRGHSEATRFFYIADNPHKDFITARKLGWMTVRIRRQGGLHAETTLSAEYEADCEAPNLASLERLLR